MDDLIFYPMKKRNGKLIYLLLGFLLGVAAHSFFIPKKAHAALNEAACASMVVANVRQQNPGADTARLTPYWQAICKGCLLYTSPSPRDRQKSRMPSSA